HRSNEVSPRHPDQRHAVTPPSTESTCPLTKLDASDARKIAAPTSSCTSPQRPSGVRAESDAENLSSSTSALFSSVRMYPGASALARRPCLPQSVAMPLVSIFTAPFEAV